MSLSEALPWLNQGDTAWQITAATLVGLMSVPGLVVLYGGVMQKRWSINSMMLTFLTFAIVLVIWVLYAFKMGFGQPWFSSAHPGFFNAFIGKPGPVLTPHRPAGPGDTARGVWFGVHVRVPAIRAGLLPARIRGDHPDPVPGLGARTRQLEGLVRLHGPLDLARLRRRCVPDLGRWVLRPPRRA